MISTYASHRKGKRQTIFPVFSPLVRQHGGRKRRWRFDTRRVCKGCIRTYSPRGKKPERDVEKPVRPQCESVVRRSPGQGVEHGMAVRSVRLAESGVVAVGPVVALQPVESERREQQHREEPAARSRSHSPAKRPAGGSGTDWKPRKERHDPDAAAERSLATGNCQLVVGGARRPVRIAVRSGNAKPPPPTDRG